MDQKRVLRVLSYAQHGSASFFSIFISIHLAAPAAALFGGSVASSQLMLLGREFYRTTLTEPLLVLLPLSLHIGAATLKRSLTGPPKAPSLLATTGWTLASILLPMHIIIHRLNPAQAAQPIFSLSPSQLDFEFVKVGLARWPIINWSLYISLVIFTALHAADGAAIIMRTYTSNTARSEGPYDPVQLHSKRRSRRMQNNLWKACATSVVISSVLGGLVVIACESLNVSRSLLARIEASFMTDSLFRRAG